MNTRRDRGWRVVIVSAAGVRTYLGPVYPNRYTAETVRRAYTPGHGEETHVVREVPGLDVANIDLPTRRR